MILRLVKILGISWSRSLVCLLKEEACPSIELEREKGLVLGTPEGFEALCQATLLSSLEVSKSKLFPLLLFGCYVLSLGLGISFCCNFLKE